MIEEFERERKAKKNEKKRKAGSEADKGSKKAKKDKRDSGNQVRGFERGLPAEKIIGATDAGGELMFLVKWYVCRL